MANQHIKIGGLEIGIESTLKKDLLRIPDSYRHFLGKAGQIPDFRILVKDVTDIVDLNQWSLEGTRVSGVKNEKVFLEPSMIPPGPLWEVRKVDQGYRISTWSHTGVQYLPVWIDFSPDKRILTIFTEYIDGSAYPMGFPAGGLITYLISAIYPSILIHGAVVEDRGRGYLFSGLSGAGKSTMAALWEEKGAQVIHDDRILIRKVDNKWTAFSTPVNPDDESRSVELQKIFLIRHGSENSIKGLLGMDAFTGVLEHCIQHQYDPTMIGRLVDTLKVLLNQVPVYRLAFKRDNLVVDYIRDLKDDQ